MLRIDRTARTDVAAPPPRCLEVLADVEDYPSWAGPITAADVLERDGHGAPAMVRLRAQVLGLSVEMECALELAAGGAVLRRLPYDARDDERFVATWTTRPAATGTELELHVVAALDAPGPARLLRGQVERRLVDDLLAGCAGAAAR